MEINAFKKAQYFEKYQSRRNLNFKPTSETNENKTSNFEGEGRLCYSINATKIKQDYSKKRTIVNSPGAVEARASNCKGQRQGATLETLSSEEYP